MKRAKLLRLRQDLFGGIAYVPHRDDFFALDSRSFALVDHLTMNFADVKSDDFVSYQRLAKLGICETDIRTPEIAYRGPSFIGDFRELPAMSLPLVVNCFATSHCPLSCIYCHADDLMKAFRQDEADSDLMSVVSTASKVPALVAVITGGDPLTRPNRAAYLIEELSETKAVVMDTSGVGDFKSLLPILVKHNVHVRVSIDSASPTENRKLRPANKNYESNKDASLAGATDVIRTCIDNSLPVSVQTVVCAFNENLDDLKNLRDWIFSLGIRNWILHLAVRGGNARRIQLRAERDQKRPRGILPSGEARKKILALMADTDRQNLPLDIRCTDSDAVPNSVLLVGSRGDLYTEGLAANGKVLLHKAGDSDPSLCAGNWPYFDRSGHSRRYLNWTPSQYTGKNLSDLCYRVID